MLKLKMLRMYNVVGAILMVHSSATACSDLNGDGVVNVADFLIFVNDFGKTVSCDHVSKVQLVIQNQFNDAVWDTSRNAEGVLTIIIKKKPPSPPPPPPPVTTPVNTNDRAVLVEFYNATGGDNWIRRRNWLSDRPLNEWWGVSTTEDGRVDSLLLKSNNLSGTIPESLGNLVNLKTLELNWNQLTGSIPETLGNLYNLKRLALGNNGMQEGKEGNKLTGSIPETLGNLRNLEYLFLWEDKLTGSIPETLGNLHNLKSLTLGNNLSGSIPETLSNLRNLERLTLGSNLTGAIPESLGNLTNLRYLNLSRNNLSGPIPETLSNLRNLEGLTLGGNQNLCLPVSLYHWVDGIRSHDLGGIPDCN